ncbi:non-heme iron oxygenase ferredoxin subunit [Iamia majanohamensis]|uniref:Non-heme iron oxygenase ferredoxin subunit n=1 Tax=Iamia majanohamensis TaxID=467976 RepID=A0AAE9Y7F2_9ACTN|nr:non-heme iron oxygenase ferredoxin subunit [Iamia majanohamensis]WCO65803.1 non-heme iron oxygenase ferredoxin subunit [Iamia majanohamensis]
MSRVRACAVSEVADGTAHRVMLGGTPVAVVHVGDDFYAVGDICSHQRISLSEGEVLCDTLEIECWKHGSNFSLVTGEPSSLPANKPVATYPVTVEDDDVYVEVDG